MIALTTECNSKLAVVDGEIHYFETKFGDCESRFEAYIEDIDQKIEKNLEYTPRSITDCNSRLE